MVKAFSPQPTWTDLAGRRATQILHWDIPGEPSGRTGPNRRTEQMAYRLYFLFTLQGPLDMCTDVGLLKATRPIHTYDIAYYTSN